jgi:uncharacterized protein YjbJ (UPF0337 family)
MGAGSGEIRYDPTGRDNEIEEAARQARLAAASVTADENDPDAVRANIERTRADLGETVNAIQERLNPQRIREEAVSTVREATVGRVEDVAEDAKWKVKGAGYTVLDTIKRNPVPAALAAIGLGWLFMETRNSSQYDRKMYRDQGRYYQGERYYGGQQYGDRYAYRSTRSGSTDYGYYPSYREEGRMEQAGSRAREAVSNVGERAGDVVDQARGRVEDVTSRVGEQAGQFADQAGQFADQARQGAQQAAEELQYRAEVVKSRFGEMLEDNPLLIGAAAVAVGAAVGLAFPTTQKENELFGEARDNLMQSAQSMASETMQKVQRVAEETADAAKDAARDAAEKQNLTGSQSTSSR